MHVGESGNVTHSYKMGDKHYLKNEWWYGTVSSSRYIKYLPIKLQHLHEVTIIHIRMRLPTRHMHGLVDSHMVCQPYPLKIHYTGLGNWLVNMKPTDQSAHRTFCSTACIFHVQNTIKCESSHYKNTLWSYSIEALPMKSAVVCVRIGQKINVHGVWFYN